MAEGFGHGHGLNQAYGDDKKSKRDYLKLMLPYFFDDETLDDMLTSADGNVEQIIHEITGEPVLQIDSQLHLQGELQEADQVNGDENFNGNETSQNQRSEETGRSKKHHEKTELLSCRFAFNQPKFSYGRGASSRESVSCSSLSSSRHEPFPPLCSAFKEAGGSSANLGSGAGAGSSRAPNETDGQYDDASDNHNSDFPATSYEEESVKSADLADDSVPLQLDPSIIEQLFNDYSNPFGTFDVKTLPVQHLQFQIPRKLAFDLYRHICMNLLDKVPPEADISEVHDADSKYDDVTAEELSNLDSNDSMLPADEGSASELRKLALVEQGKGRECELKMKQGLPSPEMVQFYRRLMNEHFMKRDELNDQAMQMIFRKNNSGRHPKTQIDLHHLYVKEALRLLPPFLKMHKPALKNQSRLHLTIVCGKGNHSTNNEPKLLPVIVNYLIANRYSFRRKDGYVIVRLSRTP